MSRPTENARAFAEGLVTTDAHGDAGIDLDLQGLSSTPMVAARFR
jgi:hypothetical protein